jgi:hypothetical protein
LTRLLIALLAALTGLLLLLLAGLSALLAAALLLPGVLFLIFAFVRIVHC